jgi:glutaminyl-tRNA synthetase
VLHPISLVLTNYPEGQTEELTAINNPEDESAGSHTITFARELYIEKDDFMEEAPKNYFRMTPGQEVRLKNAYIVKCTGCKKDENGNVVEVYAEYEPTTRSGMPDSNKRVKGTLHWVSVAHSVPAEVRLYDRLFKVENPADEKDADFHDLLNPDSLTVLPECYVEKELLKAKPLDHFQFQRIGYFNLDPDSKADHLVFNQTVSLKDTWSKISNKK